MYSVLSTGTRILPSRSARYKASIAEVSPKAEITDSWRKTSRDQPGLLPAQHVDSQRSRFSIIYERKELAFGRNRDGRCFAVAEGRRARGKIGKEHFLLVGHFAERHLSSSDQAMQKSVFAILAARFVFELTSHDLRDDDAVGNGR